MRALAKELKREVLAEVLETLESGGRPKGGVKSIVGGIPSVGGEHLSADGKFDFENVKYIPKSFFNSLTKGIIHRYDVLIVKDGATTGKTSFVGPDFPYEKSAVNEHVFIARSGKKILPKFLFYFLFSPEGQQQLRKCISGTAQGGINKSILEKIYVRYPESVREQEQIVSEIEKQITRLDVSTRSLKSLRTKLEVYRNSLLENAFRGKYKLLPAADVCSVIANGSTPPPTEMRVGSGEVPFIKVYNLTDNGSLNFTKKPTFIPKKTHIGKLMRSRIFPNDILLNIVGPPLGKVSLVPKTYPEWNTNQAVVIFRANERMLPKFLMYALLTKSIMRPLISTAKATAGQFNIKLSDCRKMFLPSPPLDIQKKIVQLIETQFSRADNLYQIFERSLEGTAKLKKSILKSAFEGKLIKGGD